MKLLLSILLMLLSLASYSQSDQWWHFGSNARTNQSSPQTPLTGGCLSTAEGLACISNTAGNLLFSTDGVTVYNSTCAVMSNGTALIGGASSTQSAIIVKQPLSTNRYYIFTAAQEMLVGGIAYSVVDMTLSAGLGAVTIKNSPLVAGPTSEKITAVRHCNGIDYWIISKAAGNNRFYSWLLTSTGVSAAIISNSGYAPVLSNPQTGYGQLKSNSSGTRLAAAYYGALNAVEGNRVELYNFDKSTGIVSSAVSLGNVNTAYGVEFSLSGQFVYASTNRGQLFQWNLCASSLSRILIADVGPFLGSMQINRYNQILCSRGTLFAMTAIMFADNLGASCVFNPTYFTTNAATRFGLPNFEVSTIIPATQIQAVPNGCEAVSFSVNAEISCVSETVQSYLWSFGDGSTSLLSNPTHGYSTPGTYGVTLQIFYPCRIETVNTTVTVSNSSYVIDLTMN